jgi:hypothetical protein
MTGLSDKTYTEISNSLGIHTVAPYLSNSGPPRKIPINKQKDCKDPTQDIAEGLVDFSKVSS